MPFPRNAIAFRPCDPQATRCHWMTLCQRLALRNALFWFIVLFGLNHNSLQYALHPIATASRLAEKWAFFRAIKGRGTALIRGGESETTGWEANHP
jgi:hypothetical protein